MFAHVVMVLVRGAGLKVAPLLAMIQMMFVCGSYWYASSRPRWVGVCEDVRW